MYVCMYVCINIGLVCTYDCMKQKELHIGFFKTQIHSFLLVVVYVYVYVYVGSKV